MRLNPRLRRFVVKPIGLKLPLHMCICFSPLGVEHDAFTCCPLGLPAISLSVR